jgi:BASS family bile acid:Na+ symporter
LRRLPRRPLRIVAPGAALALFAFLGRHATTFMAVGVLAGIAVPPLARLLAPLLVPTLLIPFTLALLRLDWSAVAACRRTPLRVVVLLLWLLVASPVLVALATRGLVALGLPPALRTALVLMAASSPIVSSVALALILGLDAALAIVCVLIATALAPLTLPAAAATLLGLTVDMALDVFMLRLALLVGTAFGAAWLIRRLAGPQRLARHAITIDGLTVVNLVLFAIAIMAGVTDFARAQPTFVALALAAAFGFNLALQVAGWVLFRPLQPAGALTAAFMSGNRNMGLVLVAQQGQAPFEVTVFFALAQIPMYVLPALLRRAYAARLAAGGAAAGV